MKKTKAELETIDTWLRKNAVSNYAISDEGVVDVIGRLELGRNANGKPLGITAIPLQFGTVTGNFSCTGSEISLLNGMPRVVGGNAFFNATKIRSLRGIEKCIQHIDEGFYCDAQVTNVLGLLFIKGLKFVNIDQNGPVDRVINKYLGTGDILSAQDELIDAGCIEQARL
jgi:hypothetical protein